MLAALKKLLRNTDWNVRCAAAETLGTQCKMHMGVVGDLRAVLGDEHPVVRRVAARALGHFGPRAKTAVGDLKKLLRDPNESVRKEAHTALGKISDGDD
jgi:HEAT repeat protein